MRRCYQMQLDPGTQGFGFGMAASGHTLPAPPYYYYLTRKNTSFHLFFSSFRSISSPYRLFITSAPLVPCQFVESSWSLSVSTLYSTLLFAGEGFVHGSGHLEKSIFGSRHQQILSALSALLQSPRLDNRTTGHV
jgi:hypothetical protein